MSSQHVISPQDSVFQDLGEGILENALQVSIIILIWSFILVYVTTISLLLLCWLEQF